MCVQFTAFPLTFVFAETVAAPRYRYEQSIAGRAYQIEVARVAQDRWRACIVRLPGVPTALILVAAVVLLTLPLSLVLKPALVARLP